MHFLNRIFFGGALAAFILTTALSQPTPAKDLTPNTSQDPRDPLFLASPTQADLVEITSQAIPAWRQHQPQKPALILLADALPTRLVPDPLHERVKELALTADPATLWRQSPYHSANPALLSDMAIRSGLENNFFSRLIWMIPVPPEARPTLTLLSVKEHLLSRNALTSEEAETLEVINGGFKGTIAGVPLLITFIDEDIRLSTPALLHLDLDYFNPLYKNEIKTPLFALLHDTLQSLRAKKLHVLGATISYSNHGGRVPLSHRFLAPIIDKFVAEPAALAGPMPRRWQLKRENLYLENFFQIGRILENSLSAIRLNPEDPAAHYDYYRALWMNKNFEAAMAALERAVALDPAYGLAYLDLARKSEFKKNWQKAESFLSKARKIFANDPIIALNWLKVLKKTGNKSLARQEASRLSKLEWSPIYYPHMKESLTPTEKE